MAFSSFPCLCLALWHGGKQNQLVIYVSLIRSFKAWLDFNSPCLSLFVTPSYLWERSLLTFKESPCCENFYFFFYIITHLWVFDVLSNNKRFIDPFVWSWNCLNFRFWRWELILYNNLLFQALGTLPNQSLTFLHWKENKIKSNAFTLINDICPLILITFPLINGQ